MSASGNSDQTRAKIPSNVAIPDRHYGNPPVVEALCEVYFAESEWNNTLPGKFATRVEKEYAEAKDLHRQITSRPIGKGSCGC